MAKDAEHFFATVEKAIGHSDGLVGLDVVAAFNTISGHVVTLLEDALVCYRRGSLGTAVFLGISALEETAKAQILAYRLPRNTPEKTKGQDPLRDHKAKHRIAVGPTTFMGRLPALLGQEACDRLRALAENGGLKDLRERALYAHAESTGVTTPNNVISPSQAREILLLAAESADDILVGSTNVSYEHGKHFEAMIAEFAG